MLMRRESGIITTRNLYGDWLVAQLSQVTIMHRLNQVKEASPARRNGSQGTGPKEIEWYSVSVE